MSEETKIYYALSLLFSKEELAASGFAKSFGPERLKKAFRAKVMQCHPDLLHNLPEGFRMSRHTRFIRIKQAYEFLSSCMDGARERGESLNWLTIEEKIKARSTPDKGRKKTIIAVGGAKGGIGKTVLSANIAAGLASLGKKVIAVDLDLGGANLHLHLGVRIPPSTLQHYFNNGKGLHEICLDTPVNNLKMIAGDSSSLGMFSITENQKKRLIKDLEEVDADYLVLDLGGDTSYNMIDFFLSADERIMVTSPEPASVLDVYNFTKLSVLRYLNQHIFDSLSREEIGMFNGGLDRLKELVLEATSSSSNGRVQRVDELLARITVENERWGRFLQDRIAKLSPYLIVNMMDNEIKPNLSARIAEIAKRNLSIRLVPLPEIPFDSDVRKTVHYLVPVLLEKPQSSAGQAFFKAIRGFLSKNMSDIQLVKLLAASEDDRIAPAFLESLKKKSKTGDSDNGQGKLRKLFGGRW
ncbi:MAG: P-loop NTPase [Pseudomonadota bacterium]